MEVYSKTYIYSKKAYRKKYYQDNKNQVLEYQHKYYQENKEEQIEKGKIRKRIRRSIDLNFRITCSVRNRISYLVRNNIKSKKTISLLGCSMQEFIQYLESKFLPEMSWKNYGTCWEIDHIIPCASFDLSNKFEQWKCFHYQNLQPLFVTTKIAEAFGYENYIGNRNKGKKYGV